MNRSIGASVNVSVKYTPLGNAEPAEHIVRFAQHELGLRCYLLLDPTLRNGFRDLQQRFDVIVDGGLVAVPIRIAPERIDKTHWPMLVEISPLMRAGSEILKASVGMAFSDWEVDSIRSGNGHRCGGWIFSEHSPARVAAHLATRFVQPRSLGRRTLIRFYDPSVLDHAWKVLSGVQQAALFGPIHSWFVVQRSGEFAVRQRTIDGSAKGLTSYLPPLDTQQWQRLDHIVAINRAWARLEHAVSERVLVQIARALERAASYGFSHPRDLEEFAWRALTVSPRFDTHPAVQQCIQMREPGDGFGYAVAEISDNEWSVIAMESNMEVIQ